MSPEKPVAADLHQAQLFIDDTWIADCTKVGRVFHQPRKFPDPVLRADRPWERWAPCLFGTVLKRGDLFQMWYLTWTRDSLCKVCYAESVDGITWEKPDLGIYEFEGSKDNNICLMGEQGGGIDCIGVIDDPEDEKWPLKAIFWQGGEKRGLAAVRSKDGKHWDWTPGLVLPGWGDRTNVMAHKDNGKYVILGRAPGMRRDYGVRLVSRTESRDLRRWSKPKLILKPDHEDDARLQFYSSTAFRYESLYLGFIERMYVCPDKLDAELVYSHDGWDWRRTRPRPRFVDWGPEGSWDGTWLNLGTGGPILHGGQMWFYYSGRSGAHGVPYPLNHGALGLAIMREDGFASLQAKESWGWVWTPPMKWPGGPLLVNVDPRRDLSAHPNYGCGELRVEVQGPSGRTLKGFASEDCIPRTSNLNSRSGPVRMPMEWKNQKSGMNKHKGKVVQLVFHIQDAHLYSFCAGEK